MNTTIVCGPDRVPLSVLRERAARAASGLRTLVAERSVVALLLRNDLSFLEATLAARLAGLYSVPINWHLTSKEVDHILHDSGAQVLVAHADLVERAGAVADALPTIVVDLAPAIAVAHGLELEESLPASDAIRWSTWLERFPPITAPADPPGTNMFYTSGTGGRPKGVRRELVPQSDRDAYQRFLARTFGLTDADRVGVPGPLHHGAPNNYAMLALREAAQLHVFPRFEPEQLLEAIERENLTHLHVVPTMFVRLLRLPSDVKRRNDLSSLQCVCHGAAPCPPHIKHAMIDWWGPVLLEYYGSTETSLVTSVPSHEWLERPGTVGRALPDTQLEIRDEEGRRLPAGTPGEIFARQSTAPEFTYHNLERERAELEQDGLLASGDIGYLDDDGYLFICDRRRDLIISGGVNIYPAEIESALLTHPAVRDCAVFGVPDDTYGEAVAVAIELEPGSRLETREVSEFLADRLATFKLPAIISFLQALPRQDNGKIYKRHLREPYWIGRDHRV